MGTPGFNRTFMELKFQLSLDEYKTWNCFNRTFMELKCDKLYIKDSWVKVLIVPLWNWNRTNKADGIADTGFNRTFMELKLVSIACSNTQTKVLIVPLWNWNMNRDE